MDLETVAQSILDGKPLIPKLSGSTDQILFEAMNKLGIHMADLSTVLEELLLNAREHGKKSVSVHLGRVLNSLFFAVRDEGVGIHETLPNNIKLSDTRSKSAAALMRLACEEGISGTGTVGRGVGLYLASKYCKDHNAEMLLMCDAGKLLQLQNYFLEKNMLSSEFINGTLVCLRIPLE